MGTRKHPLSQEASPERLLWLAQLLRGIDALLADAESLAEANERLRLYRLLPRLVDEDAVASLGLARALICAPPSGEQVTVRGQDGQGQAEQAQDGQAQAGLDQGGLDGRGRERGARRQTLQRRIEALKLRKKRVLGADLRELLHG